MQQLHSLIQQLNRQGLALDSGLLVEALEQQNQDQPLVQQSLRLLEQLFLLQNDYLALEIATNLLKNPPLNRLIWMLLQRGTDLMALDYLDCHSAKHQKLTQLLK